MDQDAFRQLLASSRRPKPDVKHIPANNKPENATTSASSASSEPAFKPRKVKKTESKYRDRAAERREGVGNDYADIEALLDDFEKRVAHEDRDVIEQQRMYLGGDSQHTILVKGLDTSLLAQNRARAATATEDDEILEQAFAEAIPQSGPTEPRKRTREEIVRDLKAKRQNGNMSIQPVVEESEKKARKFRPIGFKPVGQSQTEEKRKKRKVKDGKEGVKTKKQKVENTTQSAIDDKVTQEGPAVSEKSDIREPSSSKMTPKPPEREPTPVDENFDIFVGAGDYQGFQDDEESEEDHDAEEMRPETQEIVSLIPPVGAKGWFDEPEPEARQASVSPEKSPPAPEEMVIGEGPQEIRLKPLESSAVPSIRDFLAIDEAAEKAEKRKARKDKKKKKKAAGDDDDD